MREGVTLRIEHIAVAAHEIVGVEEQEEVPGYQKEEAQVIAVSAHCDVIRLLIVAKTAKQRRSPYRRLF